MDSLPWALPRPRRTRSRFSTFCHAFTQPCPPPDAPLHPVTTQSSFPTMIQVMSRCPTAVAADPSGLKLVTIPVSSAITLSSSYGLACGTAQVPMLRFAGPCPGHPTHMSALRAELCSINAATKLCHYVCSTYKITDGSNTLYNDCKKAHKLIKLPGRKFRRFLVDDYDIIQEIKQILQELQSMVSFQLLWVKGHYSGTNREIQHNLNEEAHSLAPTALSKYTTLDASPPSSVVELSCGFTITSRWQATIQELAHSEDLCKTICKNARWSTDTFNEVDWVALKISMNRLSRVKRLTYCKLMHGILNTNSQNKWFYKQSDLCPCCQVLPETFHHVFTCPHLEVARHRATQQDLLWKAMLAIRTPPQTLDYLKRGILTGFPLDSSLRDDVSTLSSSSASQMSNLDYQSILRDAFNQQSRELGWDQILRGRLSLL